MLHEKRFGVVKLEFGSRYEQLSHQAYALEDSLGSRDLKQKFNLFSWSFGAVLMYSQISNSPYPTVRRSARLPPMSCMLTVLKTKISLFQPSQQSWITAYLVISVFIMCPIRILSSYA
ncbi:hypothetical protein [Alishewanella longhuensis]